MSKGYQLPINEFFELTDNQRGQQIIDLMELLRDLFENDTDADWIKACLHRIPQNHQEELYVSYLIGVSMASKGKFERVIQ